MKKILVVLGVMICTTCYAQKYTVRKDIFRNTESIDSVSSRHMYTAGNYLSNSAKLQFTAIGLSVLSTVTTTIYASDDDKKGLLAIGLVSAIGAAACEILSITCKLKAGKELRLSAGELVFKF